MSAPAGPGVIQVVLDLAPGGAEYLVVEIARRLAARFPQLVCCLDRTGPLESICREHGIGVVEMARRPGFHPSLGARLAALAARHNARVLHCHHYSSFVYGRLAALFRPGLRVVFTDHGRLAGQAPSRKRRLLNPYLGTMPGGIFAVSSALRMQMLEEGFPADRVSVLHNGIDPGPQTTPLTRQRARRALGLPEDVFVVGTAARLDPVKDLGTLVEAFALARREIGDSRLVILGDGPERHALEAAAARAGVAAETCFAGYRREVRDLLPALDLFVNCSLFEGTSLTILEAMAASLPVVATTVGGTPEVVVDRRTGELIPPKAIARLASAIAAAAADAPRSAAFGLAGRERVETHFSVERMIERYALAYAAVDR